MCRLFGLHAGTAAIGATFWLLDAPDSLSAQSRRNPDGAGIGVFTADGAPVVDKHPIAAWRDADFATDAQHMTGTTFLAHVRHASTGAHTMQNTHPFRMNDRLFAHNGVVEGLEVLDARLQELGASGLVQGETDSERVFALITAEIDRAAGDVRAGLLAAVGWIGGHLPVYSVNVVLTTATDLWALRYPATNELWILDLAAGADRELDLRTDQIHARMPRCPSVVIASEPMDGEAGWRQLDSGELVHVDAALSIHSTLAFPDPPAHQIAPGDLGVTAAASQQAAR